MRIKRNHDSVIQDRPITAQRRLLLDILGEADNHLDAKELYRRAVERDRHISLATIYRNLRLFKELGLVDEIRLDEIHCYYEKKRSTEHYHLVCTACGQVIEFESQIIAKLVDEVQHNCDFEVQRAVLHLEGYCPGCKKTEEATV
ncbi:MAG: Fur family transcriptional regulator [Chloroflexota bacterium]|nr:Fur family transcriptional regulator [Chloroflexota bacterium]